jgi:hypothetical protein
MEPQFTKQLSNRFVCDYLYAYYWLVVALGILAVSASVATAYTVKGPVLLRFLMVLPNLFVVTLACLFALCLYIICERGLKSGGEQEQQKQAM